MDKKYISLDGLSLYHNNIKDYISQSLNEFLKMIYPIGSVYISANPVAPSELFGGTWEQIKDTFLLGAGDNYAAGSSGGAATHTLTVNEMPSHQHDIRNRDGLGVNGLCATTSTSGEDGNNWCFQDMIIDETANASGDFMTTFVGGGAAHNNMPPYLTVYMWKRTG